MARNRAPSITEEIESEQVNAMRARIKRALFNTALAVASLGVDHKAERKYQAEKQEKKDGSDREKILARLRQKSRFAIGAQEAERTRREEINRIHPGSPASNTRWLATRSAKLPQCAQSGSAQDGSISNRLRGGAGLHGVVPNDRPCPTVTFGKRVRP